MSKERSVDKVANNCPTDFCLRLIIRRILPISSGICDIKCQYINKKSSEDRSTANTLNAVHVKYTIDNVQRRVKHVCNDYDQNSLATTANTLGYVMKEINSVLKTKPV
jgi:hypothetical protein